MCVVEDAYYQACSVFTNRDIEAAPVDVYKRGDPGTSFLRHQIGLRLRVGDAHARTVQTSNFWDIFRVRRRRWSLVDLR